MLTTLSRLITAIMLLLLVLLIAFFPLRLALDLGGADTRGLSARSVSGTIWAGRMRDSQIGPVMLGDLDTRLNPSGLLGGHADVSFTRPADALAAWPLAGSAQLGPGRFALSNVNAVMPARDLFAPLPITQIALTDFSANMTDGACASASGGANITVQQSLLGFTLREELSGTARCDEDILLLPLRGQSGLEKLDLRVAGDGRYSATLTLEGLAGPVRTGLRLLGFTPVGEDGLARTIEGQFETQGDRP